MDTKWTRLGNIPTELVKVLSPIGGVLYYTMVLIVTIDKQDQPSKIEETILILKTKKDKECFSFINYYAIFNIGILLFCTINKMLLSHADMSKSKSHCHKLKRYS